MLYIYIFIVLFARVVFSLYPIHVLVQHTN